MNCPSCGQENRAGARFCDGCGADLATCPEESPVLSDDFVPSTGFVGRRRELNELRAALQDALASRGRLVMLAGEPGIGKTRTTQELAAYATLKGAHVLWARCHSAGGTPSYWPWVQAIRSYAQGQDTERLRSMMGVGVADIAAVVPELKERLPDVEPLPALEAEEARFRLFDSVTAFVKQVSQSQPLVVVMENLHWADRPSLQERVHNNGVHP